MLSPEQAAAIVSVLYQSEVGKPPENLQFKRYVQGIQLMSFQLPGNVIVNVAGTKDTLKRHVSVQTLQGVASSSSSQVFQEGMLISVSPNLYLVTGDGKTYRYFE